MSSHVAGRVATVFYALGGLVMITAGYLGNSLEANPRGNVLLGLVAIVIGGGIWWLPWGRWPRSRTAWVVPPFFILLLFSNVFSVNHPYRYGLSFVIIFLWVGLMYSWRGLYLSIPPFLVAYFVPMAAAGQFTPVAFTTVAVALAIGLSVGGTVAWIMQELFTAQAEVRRREVRFSLLLQHSSDLIAILDLRGFVRYVGYSIERTMGYHPATIVGTDLLQQIHPEDAERIAAAIAACQHTSVSLAPFAVRYRHADGDWRQIEVVMTNQLQHPAIAGIVFNARDVTERVEAQERMTWEAHHDHLTGLDNGAEFAVRAEATLQKLECDELVAVFFIDLDDFKQVNDRLGHAAGDQFLTAVAGRLRAVLRPSDLLARQHGDEFTVLLAGRDMVTESAQVSERLLNAFASSFSIGGFEVRSAASIGVALGKSRESSVADLLHQADIALYQSKRHGKGRVVVYEPWMLSDDDSRELHRILDPCDPSKQDTLEASDLPPDVPLHSDATSAETITSRNLISG